ncbi:hypothetical protein JP75_18135 [Devosia riboflavina]|uniref:Ketoreductase domain-containing protein n=1 Tax=Devosia riboflavina TaxID=46914 RepID=A0A087LZG0_9HYPH|nr:SDR family oxidoreductase [Devosia riboflavina]KFL30013.1 hypothetical protein JP75_18135 [Devosia riboflavina]
MKRAEGSVALITGGGSGIGATAAARLAEIGCSVAINYSRNSAGAEAVAESCRLLGVNAITLKGNVASDADCRHMAEETVASLGRLDILVNCAGVTRRVPANDLDALSSDDFSAVNAVNVTGAFQMIRAAARHLKRSGAGTIINVSSDSGITGDGSSLSYAASKGALNTLTIGLARELAPEIRVNAICPGFVDTNWALAWQNSDSYEHFKRRVADIAPLKTIPSPDDVADMIEWLVVGARCVTGQLLVIDSGTHLTVGNPLP